MAINPSQFLSAPGASIASGFTHGPGAPIGAPKPQVPNKGFGAALGGGSGGKGSKQENLISPHTGVMSTLAGGDPMSRSMGHYGKTAKNPSLSQLRGGAGGMKKNPRTGGLGPGKMATPGTSQDYSMTSPDLE